MFLLKKVHLNGKEQDILINGNQISCIEDNIENDEAEIISCQGKAILPSFCNTHTHASMMFLRGIGEDKELFSWLNEDIWPREAKLTSEMIYHLSRFAILEMIKTGTTLFADMYFYPQETIRAILDMGIRGAVSFLGMDFFDAAKTDAQYKEMETFLGQKASSDRIIKGLSCHSIYTTSKTLFLKAHELANQHNTFLHIHSSETKQEINDCLKAHNCRPVDLLNQWGVLDDKTVLAHCLHLDEDEIGMLAETKAVISHCPSSAFKLNSGQMDLQKYLDAGIRVTLGTDGVSSNNSLSMLWEMKLAALSAKNKANNILAGKVNDIFHIATKNGFDAFSLNAGEIAVGKLADFILVDLRNVFLMPNHNLFSNMIYAADSSCITDVFCNGVPVMRNKIVPNEIEIIDNFNQIIQFFN